MTSACRSCATTQGELGFAVYVGGGLGRTPLIGRKVRDFLPERDLLAYIEAILRVYNLEGRRDNKYKARIKILVHENGARDAARARSRRNSPPATRRRSTCRAEDDRTASPPSSPRPSSSRRSRSATASSAARATTRASPASSTPTSCPTRRPGYAVVTVSLKADRRACPATPPPTRWTRSPISPSDYSLDEIRVTHEQNLVLPHVALDDLPAVWRRARAVGLATPNAGLVTDIIACPGLDYCALATARSIPVAQRIAERFGDGARARAIGPLKIKISGCINACGHHHVGHIGILGLERAGEETYQITLGGSADENAAIGQITGPGFSSENVVDAVETIVETYMGLRRGEDETSRRLPARRPRAVQGGALRTKRRIGHLMSAHDVKLFGDQIAASRLESRFAQVKATSLMRLVIEDLYPGRVALVSSFGADAAALLHMVSRDRQGDAGHLRRHRPAFSRKPSPIATSFASMLGLTNVIVAEPHAGNDRRGGPGEVSVRQRSRPLLRNPQGSPARRSDGGL